MRFLASPHRARSPARDGRRRRRRASTGPAGAAERRWCRPRPTCRRRPGRPRRPRATAPPAAGTRFNWFVGKEGDLIAIRRPERIARAAGAGEWLGASRVERPQPQLPRAACVCGHEHQPGAIWRQRQPTGQVMAVGRQQTARAAESPGPANRCHHHLAAAALSAATSNSATGTRSRRQRADAGTSLRTTPDAGPRAAQARLQPAQLAGDVAHALPALIRDPSPGRYESARRARPA